MTECAVGVLDIFVTSSINTFGTQRHFPLDLKISDLKQKLELLTGASSKLMQIHLLDEKNNLIAKLVDDESILGSYSLEKAKSLHVVDSSIPMGEFEDITKVQKLEMSDETYNSRENSVRAFKKNLRLLAADQMAEEKFKKAEEEAKEIAVGSRCEVHTTGTPSRRGTVMFCGKTDFKPGLWVGIRYDEPLGKNDGSVNGKRYFECEAKYGGFVKPFDVTVGDFPEESYDIDEI